MEPRSPLSRSQGPTTVLILSHKNPVQIMTMYFPNNIFNIILPLRELVVSFSLTSLPERYIHSSYPSACYMICLSYPLWLDQYNYIWQIPNAVFSTLMYSMSKYSPQNQISNALSLCASHNIWNQVSHMRKITWNPRLVHLYVYVLDYRLASSIQIYWS
jgi:hypothetical protein